MHVQKHLFRIHDTDKHVPLTHFDQSRFNVCGKNNLRRRSHENDIVVLLVKRLLSSHSYVYNK